MFSPALVRRVTRGCRNDEINFWDIWRSEGYIFIWMDGWLAGCMDGWRVKFEIKCEALGILGAEQPR